MVNRGYNGLVIGGARNVGTDSNPANDVIWADSPTDGSAWINPTTTHNDFELPHLVANAYCVDVYLGDVPPTYPWSCLFGTSFAAPQVSGTAAAMIAQDSPTFSNWPEMSRAVLMATAFQSLSGQPEFSRLSSYAGGTGGKTDARQGAGMLNANYAYGLAQPGLWRVPGAAYGYSFRGRYAKSLDFTNDFGADGYANVSKDQWYISAAQTGRLRVAIAWDGTGTSSPQATTLDGDLDLQVINQSTGAVVCQSDTYDSSWEACDIPVTAGQTFRARLVVYQLSSGQPSTYFGVAWYNYQNP